MFKGALKFKYTPDVKNPVSRVFGVNDNLLLLMSYFFQSDLSKKMGGWVKDLADNLGGTESGLIDRYIDR